MNVDLTTKFLSFKHKWEMEVNLHAFLTEGKDYLPIMSASSLG